MNTLILYPAVFALSFTILISFIENRYTIVSIRALLIAVLVFLVLLAGMGKAHAVIDSSITPAVNHDYFYVGDRYENGIHYLDYFRPNYTFRITEQYVHTVLVAEGVDERGRVELLVFAPVMVDCYSTTTPFRVVEIVVYNSNGNLMGYNNLYAQGLNQGYAHPQVKNYVCGGW